LVGELRFVAQATVVVASLLMVGTANAALINGTSGNSPAGDDPPIIVGADWFTTPIDPPAFYWGSGAGAPNTEGGFTFNALGPVRVDVTDDFGHGDQFQVFDFGASLGVTSAVPNLNDGGNGGEGPVAAFADPTYSHGSFFLGAGAHSITIDTIVNPYDGAAICGFWASLNHRLWRWFVSRLWASPRIAAADGRRDQDNRSSCLGRFTPRKFGRESSPRPST
jgi:hypothetical protein